VVVILQAALVCGFLLVGPVPGALVLALLLLALPPLALLLFALLLLVLRGMLVRIPVLLGHD
jgi:hypothetical protein